LERFTSMLHCTVTRWYRL